MGPSPLGPRALRVITYTPALLLGASAAFVLIPATRDAALWVLAEDRPVEALTFIALLGASVLAVRLAWRHKGGYPWVSVAYVLFGAASFLIAVEEVSWGQRWLGFETPESFRGINRQGELTLHNVGALQGSSEWMRLLAGLAGLFAVAAHRIPALIRLSAAAVLYSWFLVITGHALVDSFNDIVPIEPRFDFMMQRTSEVIELLIGLAAFLYGWLNIQRFGSAFPNEEGLR